MDFNSHIYRGSQAHQSRNNAEQRESRDALSSPFVLNPHQLNVSSSLQRPLTAASTSGPSPPPPSNTDDINSYLQDACRVTAGWINQSMKADLDRALIKNGALESELYALRIQNEKQVENDRRTQESLSEAFQYEKSKLWKEVEKLRTTVSSLKKELKTQSEDGEKAENKAAKELKALREQLAERDDRIDVLRDKCGFYLSQRTWVVAQHRESKELKDRYLAEKQARSMILPSPAETQGAPKRYLEPYENQASNLVKKTRLPGDVSFSGSQGSDASGTPTPVCGSLSPFPGLAPIPHQANLIRPRDVGYMPRIIFPPYTEGPMFHEFQLVNFRKDQIPNLAQNTQRQG